MGFKFGTVVPEVTIATIHKRYRIEDFLIALLIRYISACVVQSPVLKRSRGSKY